LMTLLREIVRSEGVTLVMATHDQTVREFADAVYRVTDGQIGREGA
jgi:putative ABC transport system ATP-binding protein